MPREAHTKAAEHHETAAKSHRSAAEHHGKGDHAKAGEEFDEGPVAFEDCARTLRYRAQQEPVA